MPNIIVKNTTGNTRNGLITVGVPFSRAFNLRPNDVLIVNNAKTGVSNLRAQWEPIGNIYSDGARKYAKVTFPVSLTGNQEKTVSLTRASGSTAVTSEPYSLPSNLATNLISTSFQLSIEGQTFSFPMNQLLQETNKIEGGETNDFYARYRYFTHLPATSDPRRRYLWVDMVVDLQSGLDYIPFFFRFGYFRDFAPSEPNRPEPRFIFTQNVTLRILGARSKIRWEEYKTISVQQSQTDPYNRLYTLINPSQPGADRMAAGSSHVYKGVLTYGNTGTDIAERNTQILAIAEDWRLSENYPVTGVMPEYPSYVTSEANALTRSETLRSVLENQVKNPTYRGPYNWSTIVNQPDTTFTGTHGLRDYAYGLRGMPILRPLNYNFIPFLEFTTRQEGTRHIFYYNTSGEPISPAEMQSNGVHIFHSRFFFTGSTRGFSRSLDAATDCPRAAGTNSVIYGPDRQHHTLKMFVLQAFITMDWYSLELAKMSVNNWINNNRSDTTSNFINYWEAARAAGRAYENAAFLYELTYDQSLLSFVSQNLYYNLSNTTFPGTNTSSGSLNKTLHPGGTEVLRRSLDFEVCNQGACLHTERHWRPWEESAVSLGFYCLARAILRSQPNSVLGNRILEISRDVSSALIEGGFFDLSPDTNRRCIVLQFPSNSARANFASTIGTIPDTITITGASSGAQGRMFMHHEEPELGLNTQRVYLRNATGSFSVGESILTSVGSFSAFISYKFNYLGRKSYVYIAPTNGIYKKLTSAEEEQLINNDPGNFPSSLFPMGYFRYHRLYYVYNSLLMSAPAVVKEAAGFNYYGSDNAASIIKADKLIAEFAVDTDNGDFEEYNQRFYGYIDPNFGASSATYITPSPLISDFVLPPPLIEIITNSVNSTTTISEDGPPTILITSSQASAIGTVGSTDVSVSPQSSTIYIRSFNAGLSAGVSTSILTTINIIELSVSSIEAVSATQVSSGKSLNNFIYVGNPVSSSDPSFQHENSSQYPPPSSGAVADFHKVSALNTLLNGTVVSDYYLVISENPFPGSQGETIGINGQTLRPTGYTWYLAGSTVFDPTTYVSAVLGCQHTLTKAGRGGSLRSWSTSLTATSVDWLYANTHLEGLVINEVYDTVSNSSRKIYTPNYLGATSSLSGDQYIFVSPSRPVEQMTFRRGLILEAAVTPLELINYQQPYQAFIGGSPSNPSIARDMKMYYNIAIDTSISRVSQFDSWIFHVNGIPEGLHTLEGNMQLDIKHMFTQMYAYDIISGVTSDLSSLLVNANQKIALSIEKTEVASELFSNLLELPSYVPSGIAAIICFDSINNFGMGFVAGLDSTSDSLTKVTHLTFENFKVTQSYSGKHRIGISSRTAATLGSLTGIVSDALDGQDSVSTVRRSPGWTGRRMYVVFGESPTEIVDTIQSINESIKIRSTINNQGLYVYERPAII